jgi:alpha-L-fucosidase
MFVHWGLYSIPAGKWNGQEAPGLAEHIMRGAKIPAREYEKLASQFNPVKFEAKEWVDLAVEAGAKYLVITAKHHDGFAMYDSECSDYNIVDATPYAKDPMAALAEACRDAGVKLCFYYSHARDWHDPNSISDFGNTWDYPCDEEKDPWVYIHSKVEPQLRELLTKYGEIGLIWFDTPALMTREQSLAIKQLVQSIQPQCLVNGRIGNDFGDYAVMPDNRIPPGRVVGDYETPVTMNDNWGYRESDHNWKSTRSLLTLLVDLASKGVNFLLNVGPTAEGLIPDESVQRLREIGRWMRVNGEAIYSTSPSPYPYEIEGVRITHRPGRMYLFFLEWPAEPFTLYGLKNRVLRASLLADDSQPIRFVEHYDEGLDAHSLTLELPAMDKVPAPDGCADECGIKVVALDIVGEVEVDPLPMQQWDGSVRLLASMGDIHCQDDDELMRVRDGNATENWFSTDNWMSWDLKIHTPGRFSVRVVTTSDDRRKWDQEGHKVTVSVDDMQLARSIAPDIEVKSQRTRYYPEWATVLGEVYIDMAGVHRVTLSADEIQQQSRSGLMVSRVELVPVSSQE